MRNSKAWWNQYMYYGLIGLISLITLFMVPMLGSEAGLQWDIPNTTVGWIVWIISNLVSATLNVLLFHGFIKQAKVNVQDDPNYLEARRLLNENKIEEVELPLDPKHWHSKQYRKKGVTLFVFTLLGTVGLSQAILQFDGIKFLTQCITLLIGLIFGVLQMKTTEDYWTIEYLAYARLQVDIKTKAEEQKQITDYYEVTSVTTTEVTRQIPIVQGEKTGLEQEGSNVGNQSITPTV